MFCPTARLALLSAAGSFSPAATLSIGRTRLAADTRNCFLSCAVKQFPSDRNFQRSFATDRTKPSQRISVNMSSLEDIQKEKKELRREIRARMKQISVEEIKKQSAQVWERVFALPQYQAAESVGIFVSMPSGEIQTDEALNKVLLEDKKTLYVPRVGLDFEQCDMSLIKVHHDESPSPQTETMFYHKWLRNKWSIPEPPVHDKNDEAKAGDIDLLIVPGCAFDSKGNRMGQGKGYYDRFIEKVTISGGKDGAPKSPILVAVALKPQFLGFLGSKDATAQAESEARTVPTQEHDMPMDIVVFPHCTIDLLATDT